jgi:UDP-N-acetylmuramyl pentapeptide phosphotransferase/UDP-N-acetylglucosamine-1-phosphate transferase
LIRKLKELKLGEKINKADSLKLDDLHRHKQNTPTMGGSLILGAVVYLTLFGRISPTTASGSAFQHIPGSGSPALSMIT